MEVLEKKSISRRAEIRIIIIIIIIIIVAIIIIVVVIIIIVDVVVVFIIIIILIIIFSSKSSSNKNNCTLPFSVNNLFESKSYQILKYVTAKVRISFSTV